MSNSRQHVTVVPDALFEGIRRLPGVLQSMGFESFRKGQQEPTYQIMSGVDTICVMPTSLGKSLVFAAATVAMQWRAVVFSPLTALMQNQVESFQDKGLKASQLSGMQTDAENDLALEHWMAGKVQLLYVAPERMQNPRFQRAMEAVRPDAVYVDEGHVISQWSVNFRHHYALIGDFIDTVQPSVVATFTATAPSQVIEDMRRVLRMEKAKLWMYMPRRKNLNLQSRAYTGYNQIADLVLECGGQALVYCATRADTEKCASKLQPLLPVSERVVAFHGDMDKAMKNRNLRMFMSGEARVVVCTNAFGMGIDKPDIRGVIHLHYPGSPEALSQEVGRAGRDGKPSLCCTLNNPDAARIQQYFIDNANPPVDDIRAVFNVYWMESGGGKRPIEMTQDTVAMRAGVHPSGMQSIVEVLSGAGCIRSEASSSKVAKVKLLSDDFSNAQYRRYAQLICKVAAAGTQGYRQVDLAYLAAELTLTMATVRKHLKDMAEANRIDFVPPFRGNVTHVEGGMENLDFDYLSKKKIQDQARLQAVLDYMSTPDSQKHKWLEDYFEVPPTSVPESSEP